MYSPKINFFAWAIEVWNESYEGSDENQHSQSKYNNNRSSKTLKIYFGTFHHPVWNECYEISIYGGSDENQQSTTASPQIYTKPTFTQDPDLHGTHIYTAQIYTNPSLHKISRNPNLWPEGRPA